MKTDKLLVSRFPIFTEVPHSKAYRKARSSLSFVKLMRYMRKRPLSPKSLLVLLKNKYETNSMAPLGFIVCEISLPATMA